MDDLTGRKFGKLEVIALHPTVKRYKHRGWVCRCECGNYAVVRSSDLNTGNTKSCGCLQASLLRTHGMSKTPEYTAWRHIKERCFDPKNSGYLNYGGRGITMCDEWRQDFLAFFQHVGPRPSSEHSIDRIENDGNYEPGNCRWATRLEQSGNQRRRSQLTEEDIYPIRLMHGEGWRQVDIAEMYGVTKHAIWGAIHRTWKHAAIVMLVFFSCSCARSWINYPPGIDGKSGRPVAARAVEFNGADLLGSTNIEVSSNGVRVATAGGIDHSTSTREGYRTVRHGVGTAAGAAVLGIGLTQAGSAYSANQAQVGVSSAAASRAAAATAASKSATTIKLAEIQAAKEAAAAAAARAIPAAGATIPAVIPATVTPIVP